MDDEFDIDAEIELLEHKMDRIVKQKDKTVLRLQARIEDAEERSYKIRRLLPRLLQCYETYLTQLRQKRELAEIECHREVLTLHKRLQEIRTKHW